MDRDEDGDYLTPAAKAALTRMSCHKCGGRAVEDRDGSAIGGLPGITYRYCNGCGWSRAKTAPRRREKL